MWAFEARFETKYGDMKHVIVEEQTLIGAAGRAMKYQHASDQLDWEFVSIARGAETCGPMDRITYSADLHEVFGLVGDVCDGTACPTGQKESHYHTRFQPRKH